MTMLRSTASLIRKGLKSTWSVSWPLMLALSMAIMLIMLVRSIFGDFDQFRNWQESHYVHLLIWRLVVYSVIGFAWLSLLDRLKQIPDSAPARARIRRCELLAILIVVLFEIKQSGLLEILS